MNNQSQEILVQSHIHEIEVSWATIALLGIALLATITLVVLVTRWLTRTPK